MAKDPKDGEKKQETGVQPAADYYKLKTEAVEDLVTADESNSPVVSQEELDQYRARKGKGVPNWIKVHFIKFWFPAAVSYFFLWGLGLYVASFLDLMVITVIALGIVTDVLTNNALRFFAPAEGAYDRYMMFPKKRYLTFLWNILYAGVLMAMVVSIYNGLNVAIIALFHLAEDANPLAVEPILFGVFYVLCDSLLIGCKHTLQRLFQGVKNKNVQEG